MNSPEPMEPRRWQTEIHFIVIQHGSSTKDRQTHTSCRFLMKCISGWDCRLIKFLLRARWNHCWFIISTPTPSVVATMRDSRFQSGESWMKQSDTIQRTTGKWALSAIRKSWSFDDGNPLANDAKDNNRLPCRQTNKGTERTKDRWRIVLGFLRSLFCHLLQGWGPLKTTFC